MPFRLNDTAVRRILRDYLLPVVPTDALAEAGLRILGANGLGDEASLILAEIDLALDRRAVVPADVLDGTIWGRSHRPVRVSVA